MFLLVFTFACISYTNAHLRCLMDEHKLLYKSVDNSFTCFSSNSTIPFKYVDDDYCDCDDGSDEPCTSACLNGHFYCYNLGFTSKVLKSSRVDDHVCDCCDGSDEPNFSCENTCMALRQEADRLKAEKQKLFSEGSENRQQLVQLAKRNIQEQQSKLTRLLLEQQKAESLLQEVEAVKQQAEELESRLLDEHRAKQEAIRENETRSLAQENFNRLDADKNLELSLEEIKSDELLDSNDDGKVDDEEVKILETTLLSYDFDTYYQQIWLKHLYEKYNKTLNRPSGSIDESDQTAQDAPHQEDVPQYHQQPATAPTTESGQTATGDYDAQHDSAHPRYHDDDESVAGQADQLYDTNAEDEEEVEEEPETMDAEHLDREDYEREEQANEGVAVPDTDHVYAESEYDNITQAAIEAATIIRSNYTTLKETVSRVESEIAILRNVLAMNLGTDRVFAALYHQCYSLDTAGYEYRLCMFKDAYQIEKGSGGSGINIGIWSDWGAEDLSKQKYDSGASCWNGPMRSTTVELSCGLDSRLVSVKEPSKCVYLFTFVTPALCHQMNTTADTSDNPINHVEL